MADNKNIPYLGPGKDAGDRKALEAIGLKMAMTNTPGEVYGEFINGLQPIVFDVVRKNLNPAFRLLAPSNFEGAQKAGYAPKPEQAEKISERIKQELDTLYADAEFKKLDKPTAIKKVLGKIGETFEKTVKQEGWKEVWASDKNVGTFKQLLADPGLIKAMGDIHDFATSKVKPPTKVKPSGNPDRTSKEIKSELQLPPTVSLAETHEMLTPAISFITSAKGQFLG
ncbi:MAG: hypothetical protein SFX19_01065 [Alphaproteobacteria bacterium]|nr:hypothetical protein [Alphaproteobacteria bacterium]